MAIGWTCAECGHEVYTQGNEPPAPLKWKDGHVCKNFGLIDNQELYECNKCGKAITIDEVYEFDGEESNQYCENCFEQLRGESE